MRGNKLATHNGSFTYYQDMIAIIGRGNVASHLYKALNEKTEVCMVDPHTLEGLPENPEIILLSVSDNAIESVAKRLPETNAIIAHTAGSIPMSVLAGNAKNHGVFYPLQTFTKNQELNYKDIPVFIEGSDEEVIKKLKKIAVLFSEDVREADTITRKKLHLASVFACNFTNALACMAKDLLADSNIDFSVLLPLMHQTIKKLEYISPEAAQTGPAVRNDTKVIESHLQSLADDDTLHTIYSVMSEYIKEKSNHTRHLQ